MMNGTLEPTDFRGTPNACSSTDAPPFYWLISLSLGVAAIAGNGLVILANVMKKVKRNPTNCIITNLASVDFRESSQDSGTEHSNLRFGIKNAIFMYRKNIRLIINVS